MEWSQDVDFIRADSYFGPLLEQKVRFLSIDAGLTSMSGTLSSLRSDNAKSRRVRKDFEDFTLDIEDLDDEDLEEDEDLENEEEESGY